MILTSLPQTATILRAGSTTDGYGDPVVDWTSPELTDVPAWLQQTSSSEPREAGRDAIVSGFRCYFAPDADVRARDRVTIDSLTYEVDGDPYRVVGLRGASHLQALLRRVEG